MNIDKSKLHQLIEEQLLNSLSNAKLAASQAYETATHKENKAENKYDTLGLEAAYLAEGQSKRVMELDENLIAFQNLKVKIFSQDMEVGLGALICLQCGNGELKYIFISPVSGGTSIQYHDINIMLITSSSPLGKAIKNRLLDDDIELNDTTYQITNIW